MTDRDDLWVVFRGAARDLAKAQEAYAEAFLLRRMSQKTDGQAEYMATIDCGEALVMAEAEYEIALAAIRD